MQAPQITLPSITGVDVQLQIAGAGSRSYAFVIDWHIRLLLALAWIIIASFALLGGLSWLGGDTETMDQFTTALFLPAGLIYFFYHPVLEIVMRGRTPGKRMAGVRIVSRSGDIPAPSALLLRNVFRLIDSLPVFYGVGLLVVMFSAQHVRIGDLAAGTLLVVDEPASAKSFRALSGGALNPRQAELVHELLDRWNELGGTQRAQLAQSLLAACGAAPQDLHALNAADLRARLQSLLSAGK